MKPMMDKEQMNKMSKEARMSMMEKMMRTMKAPPMSKVSAKLKDDFKDDKEKMVVFIKDYIVNPDVKKAHCMPMALKKFGVMPAIGKSLSADELDTIANWTIENFDEKWDPNAMGMLCNTGESMKCGGEKGKSTHKCGAAEMKNNGGKCGAK